MTGRVGLTPKQACVARCVVDLEQALGRPPSIREIAAELGISPGPVYQHIVCLRERGWAEPAPAGRFKGVRLIHRPPPLDEPEIEITAAGRAYLDHAALGAAT